MPKYETAWYEPAPNQWVEVKYTELASAKRRAELRERDLRERRDGLKKLGIRNHPQTPHFYEVGTVRQPIEGGIAESIEHNNAKKRICEMLNAHPAIFGYYENPRERVIVRLTSTTGYEWATERRFGLTQGKYIIFDILGRHKTEIALTDVTPFVAIEVVDTHFHSQDAFCALLELTRDLPVVICYLFLSQKPYLNQWKAPQQGETVATIRLQCYIADGSFWFRNERIEDTASVSQDDPKVYYNYIADKLNEDRFIRSA